MTKGGFFMFKKRLILLLAAVFFIQMGIVGCGQTAKKQETKSYANDGLLGTTGGHPNIPTNPSFHTYANDKSLVLKALSPIKGIRNSRITFRGPDLYVNLDLDPNTDIETAMHIKYAALGSVSQMMPRYRVKVIVGKTS
jgi:hypothetical protein